MNTHQHASAMPPLPESYGIPHLVCLVKNIHWAYVFWELTEEQLKQAASALGGDSTARKILRVWKGQGPQRQIVCDVAVESMLGAQYLYLPDPGNYYQMEILLTGANGTVSLLSSNFVVTPFGGVSNEEDVQWASIDELYRQYLAAVGATYLASPQLWHISSPMPKPFPPAQELKLMLDTEIIIYGKATPGASVYIQGEPVATSRDGSFTLRYALTEGCSIFPIKAVSSDGSQAHSVVTLITKETY